MSNPRRLAEIKEQSKQRMKRLKFGDPVTNICAGENNPLRLCLFVRYKARGHTAECTDGRGRFVDFDADVILAGHLKMDEAISLFEPVWEARYGS